MVSHNLLNEKSKSLFKKSYYTTGFFSKKIKIHCVTTVLYIHAVSHLLMQTCSEMSSLQRMQTGLQMASRMPDRRASALWVVTPPPWAGAWETHRTERLPVTAGVRDLTATERNMYQFFLFFYLFFYFIASVLP